MGLYLHVHRGHDTPRPVARSIPPALSQAPARRVTDHDAIPLGLYAAIRGKVGELAAEHVRRILTAFPTLPRRIDRNHHVRLLAISSMDGTVTYIDCRVPDFIYVGKTGGGVGAMIPDRPLNEHEEIEWMLMHHGSWSYSRAHVVATIAEDLVVKSMGFAPESYQAVMADLVRFAEKAPELSPPPDPYLRWEDTQCDDDCDCDHCRGGIHAIRS